MQIKKTELAKIIRDEIANVIEEARRYGEFGDTRRSHAYRTRRATSSSERLRKDRLRAAQIKHGKEEYAAGKADFEAGKDMDEDPTRHGQYKTGYMDAKAEAEGGSMKEDQIKAARFDHAHLPGNEERFGKEQQLEEVGMISAFMDPAMFAGLSPAAQAILAIFDPFLTVSGVGLVSSALMTYLAGPNKKMPSVAKIPDSEAQMLMRAFQKVEREIGSDKVDEPEERKAALDTLRKELGGTPKRKEEPVVDAGIPADELGAKR